MTVGSPTKVKDSGAFTSSFYVQYQVQTVAPDLKEFSDFPNGVVSVGRRYSDFVWLSDVLHEMLPGCISTPLEFWAPESSPSLYFRASERADSRSSHQFPTKVCCDFGAGGFLGDWVAPWARVTAPGASNVTTSA